MIDPFWDIFIFASEVDNLSSSFPVLLFFPAHGQLLWSDIFMVQTEVQYILVTINNIFGGVEEERRSFLSVIL
jgi:hypothetical protein